VEHDGDGKKSRKRKGRGRRMPDRIDLYGDEDDDEEDEEGTDTLETPVLELLCRTAHIASSNLPCLECKYCKEQLQLLLAERNVAKVDQLFSCTDCQTVLTKQVKEAVSTQYVCPNANCGGHLCFFVDCTCK
jgi:hypothetical protein